MLELFMLHGILQRVGIEGVFRVCLVVHVGVFVGGA